MNPLRFAKGMRISHSTLTGDEAYVHDIPSFGLGVFLMSEPGECKSACLAALNAGYTHIDTARATVTNMKSAKRSRNLE